MALYIDPSTTQELVVERSLCFTGNADVYITEVGFTDLDLAASGATWTYNTTTNVFKKTSGSNVLPTQLTDAKVIANDVIYGLQPFHIRGGNTTYVVPAAPYRNVHWSISVYDDDDNEYAIDVMKYCNANNDCGAVGTNGQQWVMTCRKNTTHLYSRSVNFNELFYLRSNGTQLFFERKEAGIIRQEVVIDLPATTQWRVGVSAYFVGNEINLLELWRGSYHGSVPVIWSSSGGDLVESGNTACFSADLAGTYQVCIESEYDTTPLCVDVVVAPLSFVPVGLECGQCVFVGETVTFTSNAGLEGTLTAVDGDLNPVGTVLDSLTWEAPGTPCTATLTYTYGVSTVDCIINVVDRLTVLNVEGNTISGLVPGDTFQIATNYEYPNVIWENVSCPNVVSPSGLVSIPKRLNDSCFGALDCTIRCRLVNIEGLTQNANVEGIDPDGSAPGTEAWELSLCPNLTSGENQIYLDFRIICDPVFPTPEFGGPVPEKWKPETPEYKVIVNEMEGGCDETYLKNRVAIHRWTVRYNGLTYEQNFGCDDAPCCDEETGFINGYDSSYQTATRLDAFWNLVAGNSGYFTLKDYRTGDIWRRVRFEGTMERDHINWHTAQTRDFSLVWHPCCATEPMGGVCPHRTVMDNIPPTTPASITCSAVSPYAIYISWAASVDNIGIRRYEVYVTETEEIIETPNSVPYFTHTGLTPSTTYHYKVRAVDMTGNRSDWTSTTVCTTHLPVDVQRPTTPNKVRVTLVADLATFTWEASTDDTAVDYYEIRVTGGHLGSTVYMDSTPDLERSFLMYEPGNLKYSVEVRAVDVTGKRSYWSTKKTFVYEV